VVQDCVQWLPLISAVPLSKIWLINKMYFCEIGDDGRLMEVAQASISMADFVNWQCPNFGFCYHS
jgi:hypothetical protein